MVEKVVTGLSEVVVVHYPEVEATGLGSFSRIPTSFEACKRVWEEDIDFLEVFS